MAREIGGALLNGGVVALIVAGGILSVAQIVEIDRPGALALTALLTLVVATVQAWTIGAMVPIALDRLRFDPAVAAGVFITTSNDVVGVLIFFVIATSVYIWSSVEARADLPRTHQDRWNLSHQCRRYPVKL